MIGRICRSPRSRNGSRPMSICRSCAIGSCLKAAIRDAVAKLDPQFGYADGFDEATGKYRKLIWAKNPPEFASATAMIVREAEAQKQLKEEGVPAPTAANRDRRLARRRSREVLALS